MTLIRRFAKKKSAAEKTSKKLNVLGMLPLDVGNRGNSDRILAWLKDAGYEIQSDFAMGLSVDQDQKLPRTRT
ncbi:MAG: hypothetical protein ACLR2E_04340 [Lachnospiraceae bacterium]